MLPRLKVLARPTSVFPEIWVEWRGCRLHWILHGRPSKHVLFKRVKEIRDSLGSVSSLKESMLSSKSLVFTKAFGF